MNVVSIDNDPSDVIERGVVAKSCIVAKRCVGVVAEHCIGVAERCVGVVAERCVGVVAKSCVIQSTVLQQNDVSWVLDQQIPPLRACPKKP